MATTPTKIILPSTGTAQTWTVPPHTWRALVLRWTLVGRWRVMIGDMNVSELLRLLPTTRTGGRLAGQAETGETRVFADPDELLAFLHQIAATPLRDQPIPVVGLPVAATHRRPVTDPPPPLDEAGRAP